MERDLSVPCRSLGEYVAELIERLGRREPTAVDRMREIVGARRAAIVLDDESIEIAFGPYGLVVREVGHGVDADGVGVTDRLTVLKLLGGSLEVTEAILDGSLVVRGELDAVVRMFACIEILLDGSTRVPALQRLAGDFRLDPCRAVPTPAGLAGTPAPRHRWWPTVPAPTQIVLLERLGLLE